MLDLHVVYTVIDTYLHNRSSEPLSFTVNWLLSLFWTNQNNTQVAWKCVCIRRRILRKSMYKIRIYMHVTYGNCVYSYPQFAKRSRVRIQMAKFLPVSMFSLLHVAETLVRHRWLLLHLPSAAGNKLVVPTVYPKCALKALRVSRWDEMRGTHAAVVIFEAIFLLDAKRYRFQVSTRNGWQSISIHVGSTCLALFLLSACVLQRSEKKKKKKKKKKCCWGYFEELFFSWCEEILVPNLDKEWSTIDLHSRRI